MATSWLFRAIFASGLGAGVAACTLLTGVGDLSVEAGDAALDTASPLPTTTGTVPPPTVDSGDEDVQDAGVPDSSVLGDVDATVVDGCSPTGCLPVPDGFVLVAFGAKGAACPTGFVNGVDVVENETVDPTACACGCSITNAGSCPSFGPIEYFNGMPEAGATCPNQNGTLTGGPACQTDGYTGPFQPDRGRRYVPPSGEVATGLACAPNTDKDQTRVGGTSARICQANVVPQCNALICPSDPGGGFAACIAMQGVAACPKEWPVPHATGTGIGFDCDGTGCSCPTITGDCNGGTLSFFKSGNCMGTPGFVVTVDGNCAISGDADGGSFNSHLYTVSPPTNVVCTPSGSSSVINSAVAQPTTVCCTQ